MFSVNYDELTFPVILGVLPKSRREISPVYKFNKPIYVANEA